MSTLSSVILEGTAVSRPAAAIAGRLYFATDTLKIFYDNGTTWDDVTPSPSASSVTTAGVVIDGAGSVPATGSKGYLLIPYAGTITGWSLLADASGSVQITIKKCANASFPTTSSIVASAPPTLSSQQKDSDTTLTGWTTSIDANDILEFNLDSISTITRLDLQLQIARS